MTFLLFLSACATPALERADKVSLGMNKSDVLEELGSPLRSIRKDGQDVWFYSFELENSVEEREVSFKNGFVNYVGEPRKNTRKSLTEEDANLVLEKELKNDSKKKPHNFVDVKSDGSF